MSLETTENSNESSEEYYIPPFKKREYEKLEKNGNIHIYQKKLWDQLEKNIRGEINKLNSSNIENVLIEILKNNIIRGRGILVNCIMRAQLSNDIYSSVISGLSAILNCNIPDFGSLLLRRLIHQFKLSYSNNNKLVCRCTLKFLAHLINQKVVHELTALQICLFLMEKVTDDSIEVCIDFILECGEFLLEACPQGLSKIMDKFRRILHEGDVNRRTSFLIQKLFKERRTNFKNFPSIHPENDFIDEDDQITHFIDILDEEINIQQELDSFVEVDPETFEKENNIWKELSKEMLSGLEVQEHQNESFEKNSLIDYSEQNLVKLRKQVYLCIMNSLSFEECTHRLLKLNILKDQTSHVCVMLIDCCSMERTYQKFFALVSERLCLIKKEYQDSFTKLFIENYETAHRLETNKIRHVTKLFSYLLSKDAIPWSVLSVIILSEEDTASSSRIFIKILFQELCDILGLDNLDKKIKSETVSPYLSGIFPKDDISKIRFSINFFTAIGLNALTYDLREYIKNYEQKQANKLYELCDDSILYNKNEIDFELDKLVHVRSTLEKNHNKAEQNKLFPNYRNEELKCKSNKKGIGERLDFRFNSENSEISEGNLNKNYYRKKPHRSFSRELI